jgi:K+-sensing histidine kinase KdpD
MFQTLGKSFNGESSTGIGLNLVMKLIERNDVSINITNNSDVGDFVISNLEIASNKASLLDLTKKIF